MCSHVHCVGYGCSIFDRVPSQFVPFYVKKKMFETTNHVFTTKKQVTYVCIENRNVMLYLHLSFCSRSLEMISNLSRYTGIFMSSVAVKRILTQNPLYRFIYISVAVFVLRKGLLILAAVLVYLCIGLFISGLFTGLFITVLFIYWFIYI